MNILAIDDEEDFLDILSCYFEKQGHTVYVAKDILTAFELFKAYPIDLILCDYKMPKGNGLDLLEKIKESEKPIPLSILITGSSTSSILLKAKNAGFSRILEKPISPRMITETISDLQKESFYNLKRSKRLAFSGKINFRTGKNKQTFSGQIIDLSETGICIETDIDQLPEKESPLYFKFVFDGALTIDLIEGSGTIRWIKQEQKIKIGIEFTNITPAFRESIHDMEALLLKSLKKSA